MPERTQKTIVAIPLITVGGKSAQFAEYGQQFHIDLEGNEFLRTETRTILWNLTKQSLIDSITAAEAAKTEEVKVLQTAKADVEALPDVAALTVDPLAP